MKQPVYSPHPTKRLVVLEQDYDVNFLGMSFRIKKGYTWDGASIPWWSFLLVRRTPFDPLVILFSLIHDALFDFRIMSYWKTNNVSIKLLSQRNGKYVTTIIALGLHIGSWVPWVFSKKDHKEIKEKYYEKL